MGRLLLIFLLVASRYGYSREIDTAAFLANCNSIIQFYGFERAIQRNEEIASMFFALGHTDWQEDRGIISDCLNEERKLQQQIAEAPVALRYTAYKTKILALLDVIIDCFEILHKYGPE